MMYWSDTDMSGWGYALMSVNMIVFWALLVVGGVALFRYAGRARPVDDYSAGRPTSEQLLAERFARGEIDHQEYRDRVRTLRDPTGSTSTVLGKDRPSAPPDRTP
ncbi:SHOCT domain-containing protein [Nocardia arizonensis]|uniref:SHOCT domain-containing protein n=2 Tax=Nocardia TaxID=1817 RepID=UPI0006847097|nr:hypothetical protein [Nocardia arizonensis]